MLVTNDGGVYRTDNARAAVAARIVDYCTPAQSRVVFRSLNRDFGTTQFYHGAVYANGTRYLGGAQDNSTPFGSDAAGVNGWDARFGGDGGDGGYVAADPSVIYGESQYANIMKAVNGRITTYLGPSSGDYLFIAPFLLDPNQRDRIWLGGGFRLLRRDGTKAYLTASSALDAHITALDVVRGNSNRVVFGTESGATAHGDGAMSATAATVWSASKPRDGWVSSLAFDPANSDVVYATYATFGGAHVWKSGDAGATWTPIDGGGDAALPDVPAPTIAVDGATLYLGTDLGIFVSDDGGQHWSAEASFPHVITEKLVLADTARGPALFAFTHGRGAWRADVVAAETPRRRAVR